MKQMDLFKQSIQLGHVRLDKTVIFNFVWSDLERCAEDLWEGFE